MLDVVRHVIVCVRSVGGGPPAPVAPPACPPASAHTTPQAHGHGQEHC